MLGGALILVRIDDGFSFWKGLGAITAAVVAVC